MYSKIPSNHDCYSAIRRHGIQQSLDLRYLQIQRGSNLLFKSPNFPPPLLLLGVAVAVAVAAAALPFFLLCLLPLLAFF